MSSEKPDDFLTWRARLGGPDALPEQGLGDKEAAWGRLNARLGGSAPAHSEGRVRTKERLRRGAFWYGIAAALLLLMAVRLYRRTRSGDGEQVAGIERPAARVQGTADDIVKASGQTGASREVSAAMKGAVAGTRATSRGRATGSRDPMVAENPVVTRRGRAKSLLPVSSKTDERLVAVVMTPAAVTMGLPLSDSGARLAELTTPVRKPLRVVSINEIDHPGARDPAVTALWPATHFRITLNPRSNGLPPETAVQEKESTLLKIDLTP